MIITKTRRVFVGLLTILILLGGGIGIFILNKLGCYFKGYPFIPIFFYLFGLFSIYVFDVCRRHAVQKMLMLYMAIKMLKMIFSIFLLVFYCLIVHIEAKLFLLTFISFYLLYLIYETWFFFSFELNQKRRNKKENKDETVA